MNRILLAFGMIAGLTGTAFAGGSVGTNPDQPDPDTIYIEDLQYGGTGCPTNTAGGEISSDGTTFTVWFDNFVATAGKGVPITESRKNCQLHFRVHVPAGLSFAVAEAHYRGYA